MLLLAKKLSQSPTRTMPYYEFFELCLEDMLLSEESQLQENLREAIDHKIVIIQFNDNGKKNLSMPFAMDVLTEFSENNTF